MTINGVNLAGATAVHVDGEGVHMGLVLSPQPEAEDVLLHRIRLNYEAMAEGRTPKAVLQEILTDLGVMTGAA